MVGGKQKIYFNYPGRRRRGDRRQRVRDLPVSGPRPPTSPHTPSGREGKAMRVLRRRWAALREPDRRPRVSCSSSITSGHRQDADHQREDVERLSAWTDQAMGVAARRP
jgi:hypothetical protein